MRTYVKDLNNHIVDNYFGRQQQRCKDGRKSLYVGKKANEAIFIKHHDEYINIASQNLIIDAYTGIYGLALKTFILTYFSQLSKMEKIGEFGANQLEYRSLSAMALAKRLSELYNDRIKLAADTLGVTNYTYHCVIVDQAKERIILNRYPMGYINLGAIKLKSINPDKSIFFTDRKHEFKFSYSKNILYRRFHVKTANSRIFQLHFHQVCPHCNSRNCCLNRIHSSPAHLA